MVMGAPGNMGGGGLTRVRFSWRVQTRFDGGTMDGNFKSFSGFCLNITIDNRTCVFAGSRRWGVEREREREKKG